MNCDSCKATLVETKIKNTDYEKSTAFPTLSFLQSGKGLCQSGLNCDYLHTCAIVWGITKNSQSAWQLFTNCSSFSFFLLCYILSLSSLRNFPVTSRQSLSWHLLDLQQLEVKSAYVIRQSMKLLSSNHIKSKFPIFCCCISLSEARNTSVHGNVYSVSTHLQVNKELAGRVCSVNYRKMSLLSFVGFFLPRKLTRPLLCTMGLHARHVWVMLQQIHM